MKLTNKMGLPDAIVQAVKNDGYSLGDADISVTGLLSPPQQRALKIKHAFELQEDASDRIWSLMGQAIHTILERANKTAIAERRLSCVINGWTVSGGMDLYDENGILTDYKTTSVWKVLNGDTDDWTHQLNCYAHILRANGHEVNKLQVIAILRDWSVNKSKEDSNYPQAQVVNISIDLWSAGRAEQFITNRVALHQLETPPECNEHDRWTRPEVYAVKKPGGVRALKLFNGKDAAAEFLKGIPNGFIETRPGENVRCESYCPVSQFCNQRKSFNSDTKPAEIERNNYGFRGV